MDFNSMYIRLPTSSNHIMDLRGPDPECGSRDALLSLTSREQAGFLVNRSGAESQNPSIELRFIDPRLCLCTPRHRMHCTILRNYSASDG